jgi:hypothetical protein
VHDRVRAHSPIPKHDARDHGGPLYECSGGIVVVNSGSGGGGGGRSVGVCPRWRSTRCPDLLTRLDTFVSKV